MPRSQPQYAGCGWSTEFQIIENPKSSKLVRTANGFHVQFAALPVRKSRAGECEVLLITSRDTGRWVIPKGWPIPGKSGADTAAIEAYEEAGIKGYAHRQPLGCYRYNKRMRYGSIPCEVIVFPMRVDIQLHDWPERQQRKTSWFACTEAAGLVHETGLATIMRNLSDLGAYCDNAGRALQKPS